MGRMSHHEEDLRQKKHTLEYRKNTTELLKAAEVMHAKTVATRILVRVYTEKRWSLEWKTKHDARHAQLL